jgi:putative heme iron utilization protein
MADDHREAAERAAQASADAKGAAAAARDLLQRERLGVLSTLSVRRPGWPAPSLTPYALDARGEPLLLLSAIAQHTRNLEADPRACLFVHDVAAAAQDARTAPRIAVFGRARPVLPADEPDARARYLALHPGARGLLGLDFGLWVLEVEEAQWVGGFAAAGWIGRTELLEHFR